MSDLRDAAQQFVTDYENGDLGDLKHYARALRAALEQPRQFTFAPKPPSPPPAPGGYDGTEAGLQPFSWRGNE